MRSMTEERIISCESEQIDFLNKQSKRIIDENQVIVLEDLKVKNMIKSNLAKSISDASWSQFRDYIAYKAVWYGRELILVPPQYTSQTCNKCGFVSKDNRQTQSKFCCQSCGFEENADINAAKNILEKGLKQRLQVA